MESIFDDIFDDDLEIFEVLDIIDAGFPKRQRIRSDMFNTLDEYTFYRRFRLTKETTTNLFQLIHQDLDSTSHRNNSVSPMNRLLIFLNFAATGSHINQISEIANVDVSTASRVIKSVSELIAKLRPNFITMPKDEEIEQTRDNFYGIASFPRVIGCIGNTHVKIQSPGGDDAETFRNRKGYFSLNVQLVCGPDLKIFNVVARWPGSQDDAAHIFNMSRIRARFEDKEFGNHFLLGDSGYQLTNNLLTPVPNPQTRAERLYNESHAKTYKTVEKCVNVLKKRFPVLACGLRVKLTTVFSTIVAAAVLHNFALLNNDFNPPPPDNVELDRFERLLEEGQIRGDQSDDEDLSEDEDQPVVNKTRDLLINDYFTQLSETCFCQVNNNLNH